MMAGKRRRTSTDVRDLLLDSSDIDDEGSDVESANDNFDGEFSDVDDHAEEALAQLDDDIREEEENEELIPTVDASAAGSSTTPADSTADNVVVYPNRNRKMKRRWTNFPPDVRKVPESQVFRERQGIAGTILQQNLNSALDCFKQILPETIINVIVCETNRKARDYFDISRNPQQHNRPRIWYDTDADEIYAMIGILIYAGMRKNWDGRLDELWEVDNRPFYRAVMSLQRIQQLLRFLRFDNHRTRRERLQCDKLAPIRDIWNMFLENLKTTYKPSENLTIDEQLVATRGRCNFRQYIPSKPGKYGIKIFWICDAKNGYPLKGEVYVGRQPNEPAATDYTLSLVHRLAQPFINKGRTITMDNFFTSCTLADQLLAKKTTIIGTIKNNKPDLPAEFTMKDEIKKREVDSKRFCFNNFLTLLSYVPKRNKNVLLLSTLHNDSGLDQQTSKANIILDYNATKGGVDTLDKLVKTYTCKRKTRRWPMVLFFNMIDLAGVAALILHKLSGPQLYMQKKSSERKDFLKDLSSQLVDKAVKRRLLNPKAVKTSVKIAMQQIGYNVSDLRRQPNSEASTSKTSKRPQRRCYLCPRSSDIKTSLTCQIFENPACKNHSKNICNECINIEIDDGVEEMDSDDAS